MEVSTKFFSLIITLLLNSAYCQGQCVINVYQHDKYGGATDTYTGSTSSILRNDDMTSFKLTPGCCVALYEHRRFEGSVYKTCKDTEYIGDTWNDRVSSLKTYREAAIPKSKSKADVCDGVDFNPGDLEKHIPSSELCNATPVLEDTSQKSRCDAVRPFKYGSPKTLFGKGGAGEILCTIISQVLGMGLPIPPAACSQIAQDIVAPIIDGKGHAVDFQPLLKSIIETMVGQVGNGLNNFADFIKQMNLCLPVNVNPNYWKMQIDSLIEVFESMETAVNFGKEIGNDVSDLFTKCKTYTIIVSIKIKALKTIGADKGIYVTFNPDNGKVEEVGLVSGVSTTQSVLKIEKNLDVTIGASVAFMFGKMKEQSWGYALEIGGSVPVKGIGVGLSGGVLFSADPVTKGFGKAKGVVLTLSASIGEKSKKVKFDVSISCGFKTALAFSKMFNKDEQNKCVNVGKKSYARLIRPLEKGVKNVWNAFQAKGDQLERCGKIYACEAKRCAYNFSPANFKQCKDMGDTCAGDMKKCFKWQHKCEKKKYVQEKASCKKHACRNFQEKAGCKKNACHQVRQKAGCSKQHCNKVTKKACDWCPWWLEWACDACKAVTQTVCSGCDVWNWTTKTVCDGTCAVWNWTTKTVCDGTCIAWNWTAKQVIDPVYTVGECTAMGAVEVVKQFRCAKYLPSCIGMPHCYLGKATTAPLQCAHGMIAPSETCLRKNGFGKK